MLADFGLGRARKARNEGGVAPKAFLQLKPVVTMARQSDHLSPEQRSRNMAKVRGRDTGPELTVRRALFAAGFRYRLYVRDLPGHPDVVLPRYRTAVFVHGCFWHGHECRRSKRPTSNREFWDRKLDANIERDRAAVRALDSVGWEVAIIWQCELGQGIHRLLNRLCLLRDSNHPYPKSLAIHS